MCLTETIRQGRAKHPDKAALLFEDGSCSYAQLDEITDRIGTALRRRGVRPGDRVALLFTNGPEMVYGYYACFKIGAIAVPLNFRLKGPEIQYILNHCRARCLLGQEDLFSEVQTVRENLRTVEHIYLTGDVTALPGVRPFATLLERSAARSVMPAVASDAVAAILYTSGTTARPKGVTHTHATLLHAGAAMAASGDVRSSDILGIAAPLCHASGFECLLLPALCQGATSLIIPRPDPEVVLRALAWHRATWFMALPVLCNNLLHCPGAAAYDLSPIRVCLAAGDAVSPELQRRFQETFGVEIAEFWGMTEIIPGCVNPVAGVKKVGSIGLPAPGVMVRLVDDTGRDVPSGEVGELLVKSAAVATGYWNATVATAAALQNGWLRTGDLARQDPDGYYWFVGRKKEIIIRGGSNISPLEVEEVVCQHPAVRGAGVIGVPDPTWGEIVQAFVTLRDDGVLSAAELKQFLQPRLAAYKLPERITFLPELPLGATGKVHRKTLREWATASAA